MKMILKKIKYREYISLAFTGMALILFILFAYVPQKNKTDNVREKVEVKEKSAQKILSILKEGNKGIQEVKKEYSKANKSFPETIERVLSFISQEAHSQGLRINSLQPGEEELYMQDAKRIKIGSKFLYQMLVDIEMVGNFINLASYLKSLQEESIYLIQVEKVNINRPVDSTGLLNIDLGLKFYFKSLSMD